MAAQASKLEIRLLGDPEVAVDGEVQSLPASKKTRALLGYLVATGRPQRRERLCELLWDGPDDPRAGLRWSLAKLRPLLDVGGVARILADRERVEFERQGAEVDVLAVSALRADGLAAVTTERLEAALALFRGPFLEGLELSSCPAFHAWCVAEREGLRALHVDLLTALIDRHRDEPARALPPARALVALDPLAESPRVLLLDLLAALGDPRRALEEWDDYAATLRRELGIKPSAQLELRRMALTSSPDARSHRASAERTPKQKSAASAPREAAQTEAPPGPQRELVPAIPLVGRARERLELERLLSTAGRGPSGLLVLGEPGLGKTRLLEELARLALERGGRALSGRAFEAELVRPYGAFIDAMRAAPGGHPASAAEGALPAPFTSHLADRTRLYAAILADLASLADRGAPLVLVLDDLHWFDEASAELFHFLARALVGRPVLLAAAARKGELADNPAAQRLVRALGRERLASTVELGPLEDDELRRLVSSAGHTLSNDRLIAEADGNPLFALEAARALETGAPDLAGPLSGLMADRLGRLHDADRALLSWAAALGRSFDAGVLSRVTGLATPELLESLERLERFAILRSRDAGYDFAHDLMRQAAYRQMSSPRRRLVHAQIARALSNGGDPDGPLASDVAHHAGLAGDAPLAARACIAAGHRCLRLFARREACDLAHRGRGFASSLPDGERVALGVELVAIELLANFELRAEASLSELAAEARRLGLASIEARAHYLRSVFHYRAEDSSAAFESALSRVEATRHSSPRELGAELAGAARCCLSLERSTEAAAEFVARARSLLGTESDDMELILAEGLLAKLRGELDIAAERLGHALFLARRQHQHWEQCECLLELAWIDLDRGLGDDVLRHVAQLCDVAERLGESAYAPAARCVQALVSPGTAEGAELAPFAAFEASLPALAAAGANRLLSIALNRAAEIALRSGDLDRARRYAARALAAGELVQRPSEIVAALVTLAQIAQRSGDCELARRQLETLAAHARSSDLSARVTRALSGLHTALEASATNAPVVAFARTRDG